MHTTAILTLSCLVIPDVATQMSERPKNRKVDERAIEF
jgi:hypothetical protein